MGIASQLLMISAVDADENSGGLRLKTIIAYFQLSASIAGLHPAKNGS
jgi:hypothetical protein